MALGMNGFWMFEKVSVLLLLLLSSLSSTLAAFNTNIIINMNINQSGTNHSCISYATFFLNNKLFSAKFPFILKNLSFKMLFKITHQNRDIIIHCFSISLIRDRIILCNWWTFFNKVHFLSITSLCIFI